MKHRRAISADPRILGEEECARIAKRILGSAKGGGETDICIESWWSGDVRWGRSQVTAASDRRDVSITVSRLIDANHAAVTVTNQTDDESLDGVVRAAERILTLERQSRRSYMGPPKKYTYPSTTIWSDATRSADAAVRRDTCRAMIDTATKEKMLSAGYLEHRLGARAKYDSWGRSAYAAFTMAQCSNTIRNDKGTGSGWAGLTSYDWAKIDPNALAARALEKCLASQDPVALEPGRYTTILEPQAVGDLLWQHLYTFDRGSNEHPIFSPMTPFQLQQSYSKLGLQVADERVTISFDPADPELGALPFGSMKFDLLFSAESDALKESDWEPLRAATWIDKGEITALSYSRDYALTSMRTNEPLPFPPALRMMGGDTSVQQMIESTTRGILVTRFSQPAMLNSTAVLVSGLTRDGLWLIENGKITKPIKNFRFTESPYFMLNNIEQIGPSVPIFSPAIQQRTYEPKTMVLTRPQMPLPSHVVVPPLKVRDFSFSSMADAT